MKLNILFVDDDTNLLAGVRTMMHSMRKEWKCRYASSTADALELVGKYPFDVVVSDMRMPGMDGSDFLKEVEKIQQGAVRIILSGYSEMQAQLKSTGSAHQFLSKPCSTDTIVNTIRRVAELKDILTDDKIRKIVSELDSLPVIPELITKIREELERPDPDIAKVGRLVEQDAGTSATLLKVVNSTFFGFYEKITSPSRAVVMLGTEVLKGLVLGVNLLRELDVDSLNGYSVYKLWDHSLQTGYFARAIAKCESTDRSFIDCCFVSGLLHDVGKLVLITKMDSFYQLVLDAVAEQGGPVVKQEMRVLGATHAGVGAYLLGLWGFNEDVVKSVYSHHSFKDCGDKLTAPLIVHVADCLQHEIGLMDSDYVFYPLEIECLEKLNLQDRLEVWKEECAKAMEDKYERC
ncbi:response regulator [Maridesulfovibrio sp.]|uniref:response regulator n=1 Tax=Maridesulfovibrio sp. TaxID=2795000 RepID=UPI002A18E215|nr:response regulator [Maridesulfovibrio sp.]